MLTEDELGPADEALLDLLSEGRVTAPFAADEADYSLQYTRDRLGRLVEHGNAKKVYEGLYELVEDPRTGRETEQEGTQEPESEPDPEPLTDTEHNAVGFDKDDVREKLREMDLPGSGSRHQKRVEAVATIWEELQSNPAERLAKSDFAEVLKGEEVGYSSFDSLWSNWVKSNPAQGHEGNVLEQLPGVEMDGDAYVYRGR